MDAMEISIPANSDTQDRKTTTPEELTVNDIGILHKMKGRLEANKKKQSSLENTELSVDELEALFKLFKKINHTEDDVTFFNFSTQWKAMNFNARNNFFQKWLSEINETSRQTATLVLVVSAAAIVFVAVVVVTLVTPISPFARVNALEAYC